MFEKQDFINTLNQLKETSPKRKFSQAVDMIIVLKDLDLKKPDEQLDVWVQLGQERGKPIRVCALVGPEMAENAKAACDTVVLHADFKKYQNNKKEIKKLAKTHDYFIAQANIMPDVAKFFGRFLGPRGKMPNPKAGCVVPPNANLKVLIEKLKKTLHVVAKTQMAAKFSVGKQDMSNDQLIENIMTVYSSVIPVLPLEINNIKAILLKYSMGPPLKVGAPVKKEEKKKEAAPVVEEAKEVAPKKTAARKTKAKVGESA